MAAIRELSELHYERGVAGPIGALGPPLGAIYKTDMQPRARLKQNRSPTRCPLFR
jgi:hypothetical protein